MLPPPFGVPGVPAEDDPAAAGPAATVEAVGVSSPEAEESPVQTMTRPSVQAI